MKDRLRLVCVKCYWPVIKYYQKTRMGFIDRCNAEPFLFLFSAVRSWHTHYSGGFMVWLTAGWFINVCGKQKQWTLKQYDLESETETSVTA